MQIEFKIRPVGEDARVVTAGLVDVIAWEEKYEKPSTELAGGEVYARDYVWLAWHSEKRRGKTDLEFMDWVATLEDIESAEESAPLAPSESPPSTGSSPA